ncbi:MAG: hypothetical protein IJV87_04290 [Clostridia bacterium]|nr:hypothetical protein [Clostridia bacterium]
MKILSIGCSVDRLHLIQKGFKIVEASKKDAFEAGSILKVIASNKISPSRNPIWFTEYRAVTVENQYYIVKNRQEKKNRAELGFFCDIAIRVSLTVEAFLTRVN